MYKIEPFYEDGYFILSLIGHVTYKEYLEVLPKIMQIVQQMNGKFGVITDMSQWISFEGDVEELASQAMMKMVALGMVTPGARVIANSQQEILKDWQEAGAKAGYTTRYFTDKEAARKFIKDVVIKHRSG